MNKPLAALLAATILVAGAACSGGGGGGGGARPNPGHGTGTLQVIATATAICLYDTEALATCQTPLTVIVHDQNDQPITDARVTFGPPASPVVMTNGDLNGYYTTLQTSLAASYELSVVHGSADSLTGVVMVPPHDFRMTLLPDPPTVNAPAKLTWTPSGASGVTSLVEVIEIGTAVTTYTDSEIHSDDGRRDFTASAFPAADTYEVEMGLATQELFHGARPGSSGLVLIARPKTVNVQ